MYMYVGRLQTARVEGMMHIGETEEWENWKLFYIDHVTLYRIKFNRLKKKKKRRLVKQVQPSVEDNGL